jgi:rare lipoprotein A (peptidoglycan hydrolase)
MTGYATWYSTNSCAQDDKIRKVPPRTNYFTASGKLLDERSMTCALPFLPRKVNGRRQWGQKYRVTNLSNGQSVIVEHQDYGPAAWTKNAIDLTPAAFKKLANLGQGKVMVRIEKVK